MSTIIEEYLEEASRDWLLFFEDQVNELATSLFQEDVGKLEMEKRKNPLIVLVYSKGKVAEKDFPVFLSEIEAYIDPRPPGMTLNKDHLIRGREMVRIEVREWAESYLAKAREELKKKINSFVKEKKND